TATDGRGRVLAASDAEVSVIAAHVAGVAADTALGREPSWYPNSLYLIGLARASVFEAPFHTIPIETDRLLRATSTGFAAGNVEGLIAFMTDLLKKNRCETTCASAHCPSARGRAPKGRPSRNRRDPDGRESGQWRVPYRRDHGST